MEEDMIFFAMGFKSFDVARDVSRAETWYDWTERGRRMMSRASFSQKTMEWICSILKEASKVKGNVVRRWKRQEHVSNVFCARNFNNKGRYISIINIQGKNRAVIIIPEITFNAGWWDLATKIEKFINGKAFKTPSKNYKMFDKEISYAETIRRSKWSSREIETAIIEEEGNTIIIDGEPDQNQNELLGRSLVGRFPENGTENPTLSEVRRWVSKNWTQTHGINIYEMGHNHFLFEFSSITVAEHILRGRWLWMNQSIRLQWWTPTVGATQSRTKINHSWIRLVGLPLHLWSQNVFKAVGDFCGGWVKTEEETELRNHLKWARILVKNNEKPIPKEVKVAFGGHGFILQIWDETPTRFFVEEEDLEVVGDRRAKVSIQQVIPKGGAAKSTPLTAGGRNNHVGSSKVFEFFKGARALEEHKGKGKGKEIKMLGPDPLAQHAAQLNQKKANSSERISEPLNDEIEANRRFLMEQNREGVQIPLELADEGGIFEFGAILRDDDDMSIIQTEERIDQEIQMLSDMQLDQKAEGEGTIEDILPLNSNELGTDTSAENEISSWVQQNIIRLSKEFGVHFIGCEEVALNLFMAIDNKRQTIEKGVGAIVPITPVGKVPNELKNLEPKSNFVSYGTRSRGGCFIDDLNES
ncbi:hypothetical protein MTR67_020696 [Solanum verrucosum]|uniref:DUF4283 domain-containing protein n=1 Tax=Solanum verrucosum TaxID=315347 RepID=A0AAF0QVE7_SOLVR|nr:hypothetical protein MTR67_020696 [Solanum verrucosum]